MSVTVRLYAGARAAAGTGQVQLAAGDVAEVLAQLAGRFGPPLARVLPVCTLLVDGARVAEGPIADGCVLEVLPPFAGG